MTRTTHQQECNAPALYVALELGSREWWLTISATMGGNRLRVRIRPGDRAALRRAVQQGKARWRLAAAAPVRSCYEAGRDGFWPTRWLTAEGISNVVVDSSSIEVPRRARRAKTDRLDGEKLLQMLLRYWAGERGVWHVVAVPTREAEDARQASRALTTVQADRTRFRNRIQSLLALHGVRLRLDERFPQRVLGARDWAGERLPPGVQARVLQVWRILQQVEQERTAWRRAEQQRAAPARATAAGTVAQRLARLRGVAARTATVLSDELFSRALRNRRQVGALAGLVSTPHRSGQRILDQGLMRSGLPAVRRIAVEIAWAWTRYQPQSALTRWYQRRFGGGGAGMRRLGIVALARRVIIALWRYSQTGLVPAGALLKP